MKEFLNQIKQYKDNDLIKKIKSESNIQPYINEICKRHSGIYINMVNIYSPSNSLSCRDELIADKMYYIYQAALKFDPSRGTKFSTHLGNETKWMCLNIYNKGKNRTEVSVEEMVTELSEDFNFCYETEKEKNIDFGSFYDIMEIIKKYADSRIYKIFQMRYIDGHKNKVMPWKMISEKLDMSIQGCINIHDSTILKLQNKLKNK